MCFLYFRPLTIPDLRAPFFSLGMLTFVISSLSHPILMCSQCPFKNPEFVYHWTQHDNKKYVTAALEPYGPEIFSVLDLDLNLDSTHAGLRLGHDGIWMVKRKSFSGNNNLS